MSAVERLAKALRGANMQDGPGSEHGAEAMLYVDPTLAADLELGAAWREAEEALPEGWALGEVRQFDDRSAWAASADNDAVRPGQRYHWSGDGPTPAAALRALAAKLREAKP